MSKIDLLDQKWIDLVFEGKNEAYGAYQIRRDTGKRNLMGLLIMLLGIAVIWGGAMGVSKVSEAIAASREHETVVELEAVEEEAPEEEEEIEVVYQQEEIEQLVEQQEVMNSEKFTAYEADDDIKPEEQTKTQDEMAESTTAVGALDFDQGSDEAEHVLQLDEKVVEKKPEVVEEQKIFDVVEQQPTFPGGDPRAWISQNIHYPPVAEENGVRIVMLTSALPEEVQSWLYENHIEGLDYLFADATAIETMMRGNPGFMFVRDAVVVDKGRRAADVMEKGMADMPVDKE